MNYLAGINEKKILKLIYAVSAIVFLVVIILGMLPRAEHTPQFIRFLPTLNAFLNGTCCILLVISYIQIRKKNVELHKKLNLTAFALSTLFLISYVTFHSFGVETRYPADNPMRPFYLAILISHIILAAVVLPLVLISFYFGLTGKVKAHRKITRWSFPIWLYVTFTGVVVYLMISPYYNF
mgnify:CR=1 FL=1